MEPITRSEQYLASIIGEEVELPVPQSRIEHYLNIIAQNRVAPSPAGLINYDPDAAYPDGSIGKEVHTLDGDVDQLKSQINEVEVGFPQKSASGSIVTIEDGADNVPVVSLEAGITPVQDLHGYDSPWPAGGGKNLVNLAPQSEATYNGVKTIVYEDNRIVITGVSTGAGDCYLAFANDLSLNSGDIITLSWQGTSVHSQEANVYLRKKESSYLYVGGATGNSKTIALNEDMLCDMILLRFYASPNSINIDAKLMIERGSTVTPFAPYSNICPISGWDEMTVEQTGKNLYPYDTIPIYTYGWYSDYTFDGTPNKIFIKANTNYVLSYVNAQNTRVNIRVFDTSENLITDTTVFSAVQGAYSLVYYGTLHAFSISGNVSDKYVVIRSSVDAYISIIMGQDCPTSTNAQLELGSTATEYAPYNGRTISIPIGSTVYSGELDVVTGVVTVTHGMVDLGTLDWIWVSGANSRMTANITGMKIASVQPANMVCSIYATVDIADIYLHKTDCAIGAHGTLAQVWVYDTRYTDATAFKTAVTGQTLVYELATPQTIQLTPQKINSLLGTNNIWADTGDINLTYRADPSMYTAEQIRIMLNAMVAPVEATTTASKPYNVNDFLIYNNTLYKVIANIASGGTITINTNVSATTVGEQLTAILNS